MNFVIYDDADVAINIDQVFVIEKQDQEVELPENKGKALVSLIVFASPSGVARPIAYPSADVRDKQFEEIKNMLRGARPGVSLLVPNGMHPASRRPGEHR